MYKNTLAEVLIAVEIVNSFRPFLCVRFYLPHACWDTMETSKC